MIKTIERMLVVIQMLEPEELDTLLNLYLLEFGTKDVNVESQAFAEWVRHTTETAIAHGYDDFGIAKKVIEIYKWKEIFDLILDIKY